MKSLKLLFFVFLIAVSCACSTESEVVESTSEKIETEPEEEATPKGKIVFSSYRGEDSSVMGIHILDIESGEFTELDTGFPINLFPKWSPDGSRILFSTPVGWFMYILEADGSGMSQLTTFRSNNGDWSPDGSQVVLQSDHDNEPEDTPDLYIIDANGESLVEILDEPEFADYGPRWSPDGDQILFISTRSGMAQMYVLNLEDLSLTQLMQTDEDVIGAAWSPDGRRIVYSMGANTTYDIYVVDIDDVLIYDQLTNDGMSNIYPAWSPDSNFIVYCSDRSGSPDLWIMKADGSDQIQLTNDTVGDLFPDWTE